MTRSPDGLRPPRPIVDNEWWTSDPEPPRLVPGCHPRLDVPCLVAWLVLVAACAGVWVAVVVVTTRLLT